MEVNDFVSLMESLEFDELLNTLGYEIAQMYIHEIKQTQYHNLHIEEEFDNNTQTKDIQPFRILPRLNIRKVKTTNQNGDKLYSFEFNCMSGLVTL